MTQSRDAAQRERPCPAGRADDPGDHAVPAADCGRRRTRARVTEPTGRPGSHVPGRRAGGPTRRPRIRGPLGRRARGIRGWTWGRDHDGGRRCSGVTRSSTTSAFLPGRWCGWVSRRCSRTNWPATTIVPPCRSARRRAPLAGDRVRHVGPVSGRDRTRALDCDGLVTDPNHVLHRAVDVRAPDAVTWRWLCQLRVAPYSHDWIDNLGRRSPRSLTPGVDDLAPGQRINTIFRITSFDEGRSIAMRTMPNRVGDVACTYVVNPRPGERVPPVRAIRRGLRVRCAGLGHRTGPAGRGPGDDASPAPHAGRPGRGHRPRPRALRHRGPDGPIARHPTWGGGHRRCVLVRVRTGSPVAGLRDDRARRCRTRTRCRSPRARCSTQRCPSR